MNNFSLSKGSFAIQYTKYCFTTFPPTRVDLSRNTARVPKRIHRRTNNNKGQQRRFFLWPRSDDPTAPCFCREIDYPSSLPPPSSPLSFFLRHFYNGPKKGSPFSPRIENNAESSAAGEIRRGPASTPRVWYIDDTGVGVADLEED